jgi:hypothetical protein
MTSRFYDYLRVCREWHPTLYPVWVRRQKLREVYGWTTFDEDRKRFWLVLNSEMGLSDQAHTLAHEWAHCIAWFDEEEEDHGPRWAEVYGRIYQDLFEL